ncbi:MAG: hypothetical protein U5N86_04410 [Planctomycetota bacterium]|nr:hypothetical protein [Planctomycetota bacterium]
MDTLDLWGARVTEKLLPFISSFEKLTWLRVRLLDIKVLAQGEYVLPSEVHLCVLSEGAGERVSPANLGALSPERISIHCIGDVSNVLEMFNGVTSLREIEIDFGILEMEGISLSESGISAKTFGILATLPKLQRLKMSIERLIITGGTVCWQYSSPALAASVRRLVKLPALRHLYLQGIPFPFSEPELLKELDTIRYSFGSHEAGQVAFPGLPTRTDNPQILIRMPWWFYNKRLLAGEKK